MDRGAWWATIHGVAESRYVRTTNTYLEKILVSFPLHFLHSLRCHRNFLILFQA